MLKEHSMTATAPRVEPVRPPFPPELQAVFDRIMPSGVPPLTLFTTLARAPRIYERFRAGSLLDRGPISLRHREIVIDRACARCGCAYEWGVHVGFFAERVALTPEQIRATVRGDADDPAWSNEEKLLIRMVDELHDSANLSDEVWDALAAAFSVEQILELIALVGFYHTVSFFANGLRLAPEPYGVPFPPADAHGDGDRLKRTARGPRRRRRSEPPG
jgi:alkylhydroperoxidase family enzyme